MRTLVARLTQFFAIWLVMLTLSPLTAPFCACDVSVLPAGATHAPASRTDLGAVKADTSPMPLVSRASAARRVRLLASEPSAPNVGDTSAADARSVSTPVVEPVFSPDVSATVLRI
jgi:hypothetical protein